jgi:hypothetical protein
MGRMAVFSWPAVNEGSVIDSDNRRIEAKRWVFWGSMGGQAIAFACQIAVFARPPPCPRANAAGLAGTPLPKFLKSDFLAVFAWFYRCVLAAQSCSQWRRGQLRCLGCGRAVDGV